MLQDPSDQLATIGAIDPDAPQFLGRAAQAPDQQTRPCCIRERGGRDHHDDNQTHRVDQEMPFAPRDLFARILAAQTWSGTRLQALSVQAASRGVLMASGLATDLGAQPIVDALPSPIIAPHPKVRVEALPLGIVLGQHPPLTARNDNLEHRIDQLTHVQTAWSASGLCCRDMIFDTIPVAVGQIGGVCLCAHTPNVPYPLT
jgi:hypothetical protein